MLRTCGTKGCQWWYLGFSVGQLSERWFLSWWYPGASIFNTLPSWFWCIRKFESLSPVLWFFHNVYWQWNKHLWEGILYLCLGTWGYLAALPCVLLWAVKIPQLCSWFSRFIDISPTAWKFLQVHVMLHTDGCISPVVCKALQVCADFTRCRWSSPPSEQVPSLPSSSSWWVPHTWIQEYVC